MPLKNIQEVKKIKKSWYFAEDLCYFEIKSTASTKDIYGCKKEQTADLWIKRIEEARIYHEKLMYYLLTFKK